jgi:hypothetical protein
MNKFQRVLLAASATLALASGAAQASGDITAVNASNEYMSPYVKTNCWARDIIDAGPETWVFFGTVVPGTQFTWDRFHLILDPHCKHPVVKFTFVVSGSPAPIAVVPSLTQLMHYDATENYRIVLGGDVAITERP